MTVYHCSEMAVSFSETMSDEDFLRFLSKQGLSNKDCEVIESENQYRVLNYNLLLNFTVQKMGLGQKYLSKTLLKMI